MPEQTPPLKLQFSDGEAAVIREARMIYEITISTIAKIHGVKGRIDVDPQFRGFVDIEALENLPAQAFTGNGRS